MCGKIKFWLSTDRIGPDIPLTHWRLHFQRSMIKLCKQKFYYFGSKSEFRPGAYAICCNNISIGNRVVIRPGSMLFADSRSPIPNITIEDDVLLGSCVQIYVSNHKYSDCNELIINQGDTEIEPVTIKSGAWIGASVIILPGVTVGNNAVVGAGSIVTHDVNEFTVVAGNPAKVIHNIKG